MPVSKPAKSGEDKYLATTWGGEGEDLTMPSGQLALVRRPGAQNLVAAGIIHSMDSLTAIAEGLIEKAEGGKQKVDAAAVMKNPEKIVEMLHVIDKVVCHVVIKPTVTMTPNDRTARKEGVIYADMIDLEDKMFIFNYAVGGTRDVERFRLESSELVGDVGALTEATMPTE